MKSNREREMENMREKPRHIEAQALIIRYPLNQKRENKWDKITKNIIKNFPELKDTSFHIEKPHYTNVQ